MNIYKLAIYLITLFLVPVQAMPLDQTTGDWTLTKEENEIKVYIRNVKGYELIEFQGTTTINATTENVVDFIVNVDKCREWLPDCKSATLIKKYNDEKYDIYREINIPWPMKNRDYLIQYTVTENSETGEILIQFSDIKDKHPKNRCCVRMQMVKGFFRFTPSVNNTIEVTYRAHIDIGGSLPISMLNKGLPDGAINHLSIMKRTLEKK